MEENLQPLYVKHKYFDVGDMLIVRKLQDPQWWRLAYRADNNVIIIEEYNIFHELKNAPIVNNQIENCPNFMNSWSPKFQLFQFVKHKSFPEVGRMLIVRLFPDTAEYGARYLADDRILVYNKYHENELEPFEEPLEHPVQGTLT